MAIARTLMYKGTVYGKLYTTKNGKICPGENKDDEETFLKEYNNKLKNLYEKFHTEEAVEIAKNQKEYAQFFYDKLVEQITETYNSKEMSHFQNSVSFGNGFGKTSLTTGFSTKSKVAFPKTEVLEKPQIINEYVV